MSKPSAVVLLWRWHSGASLDGRYRTNATWTMPSRGDKPVKHPTDHAVRWHHMPRMHRAAIRTGTTLALAGAAWGLVTAFWLTVNLLVTAALAAAGYGIWRTVRRVRRWRHHRRWVRPLTRALTPQLGSPPVRLEIDRDRSRVLVGLPEDFTGSDRDKEGVTRAVTAKLAIEAPDASWKLDGRKPLVTFTRSEPPPSRVTWDDVAAQVDALGPDDLMIGPGKKASMVTASLASDSPHLLIAMGTGGGKSNSAAFWLVQQLRRGAIGLFLDAKHHSHPWAFKDMDAEFGQLPNVAYARRTQDLHDAMVWLADELDRRNQVALRAINAKGDILGDVGPRLFIVAEELNLATPRLKQHWADIRTKEDVKKSPALTGMGEVAFAGRAVKMHLIVIGQMMTAESLGGGAVRENMGIRCMARYTQNSWKMLAGDTPMPPSPSVPGRVQCLTSGTVREAQVPLMDLEQARELAVGGVVTPCPAGMPGISREAVAPHLVPASRAPVTWPSDQGLSLGQGPVVPPARPPRKTLSEAHAEGMFGDRTLWAVRKAAQRAELSPAGMRGTAHEYEISDLYALAKESTR